MKSEGRREKEKRENKIEKKRKKLGRMEKGRRAADGGMAGRKIRVQHWLMDPILLMDPDFSTLHRFTRKLFLNVFHPTKEMDVNLT